MPSGFDDYMPRTSFQLPDGDLLCVGTKACDDQIHQAVFLSYTPAGASEPSMALELPPKSVEVLIRKLQEYANQARFVNGMPVLDYIEPRAVRPAEVAPRKRKVQRGKKTADQPGPGLRKRPSAGTGGDPSAGLQAAPPSPDSDPSEP